MHVEKEKRKKEQPIEEETNRNRVDRGKGEEKNIHGDKNVSK